MSTLTEGRAGSGRSGSFITIDPAFPPVTGLLVLGQILPVSVDQDVHVEQVHIIASTKTREVDPAGCRIASIVVHRVLQAAVVADVHPCARPPLPEGSDTVHHDVNRSWSHGGRTA